MCVSSLCWHNDLESLLWLWQQRNTYWVSNSKACWLVLNNKSIHVELILSNKVIHTEIVASNKAKHAELVLSNKAKYTDLVLSNKSKDTELVLSNEAINVELVVSNEAIHTEIVLSNKVMHIFFPQLRTYSPALVATKQKNFQKFPSNMQSMQRKTVSNLRLKISLLYRKTLITT